MRPTIESGKILASVLAAALGLSACGGGGGGSSTGGGTTPASLSVQPTRLALTADSGTSYVPSAAITITVSNGSTSGTYVGANYTNNAITGLAFSGSGPQSTLTVSFKDPSVIGPGTYTDSVDVAICTDSTCTQIQSGSKVTVPVTYTVTVSATVNFSASPTTTGVGMPSTLTWSSTNAQSCTASGEWTGSLASAGSQIVTPTSLGDHTYTIRCSDPGTVAEASVTIAAASPTLVLTAFPETVAVGKPATLRWQGQYVTACVASGGWSGSLTPAGFQTLPTASVGTLNFHLVCSNATASASADTSVTVVAAPAAPPASAYRMSEKHDGVLLTSTGIQHPANSAPAWTVDFGAPVSYPLIANGMVFVATANPGGSYGNRLYGLDAHTGATIWGPVAVAGTYFGSGLTYENGRVFILMFDGALSAFNASDGAALWSTQLPGYWYEASPNAYGGIVFVDGNGGLSAVHEPSGTILWTNGLAGTTDFGSPAVSSEGVYTQNGPCNTSAYDPATGPQLWRMQRNCNASFAYTASIKNGTVFGRTGGSVDLFDAVTGSYSITLGSERAPAITDTALITLNAGTLSSTRLSDRVQTWTFTGDGTLVTAPVVVNDTVFVGSTSGNVYGLDVATGAQTWIGTAPLPISPDSESGGPMPPSGPAAGEDMLVFPAGNSLVGWQLQ